MFSESKLQKYLPGLAAFSCLAFILIFDGIFIPFILALGIAFLLAPSVKAFQRYLKKWELSLSLFLLASLGAILLFLALSGNFIARDISRFNEGFLYLLAENQASLDEGGQKMQQYFQKWLGNHDWEEAFSGSLAAAGGSSLTEGLSFESLQDGFEKLKGFLPKSKPEEDQSLLPQFSLGYQLSSFVVYFFLILFNYPYFESVLKKYQNQKLSGTWRQFSIDFNRSFSLYFRLRTKIILWLMPLYLILMLSLDLPGTFLYLILIFVCLYIPYLQYVTLLPMMLSGLILSAELSLGYWQIMAIILAVFVIASLVEELLLVPRIMEKNIGLNPAIMVLGLSFFTYTLGNMGILLGIPLTSLSIIYFKRFIIPLWFSESEEALAKD